jgi:hypothetical protein
MTNLPGSEQLNQEASHQTATKLEPGSKKHSTRGNIWRGPAIVLVGIGAVCGYLAANNPGHEYAPKATKTSPGASATGAVLPTTTTTIAPDSQLKANFVGDTCAAKEVTVQAGNSLFGLSTIGLHGDPTFMNNIFTWNLNYYHEQAKKDKALSSNPNDLQIGEKFKVYSDCIGYLGTYETYNFIPEGPNSYKTTPEYVGQLIYQDYEGRDGKVHNLVTVDYEASPKGAFLKVLDCDPQPSCYKFVDGAPSHEPSIGY